MPIAGIDKTISAGGDSTMAQLAKKTRIDRGLRGETRILLSTGRHRLEHGLRGAHRASPQGRLPEAAMRDIQVLRHRRTSTQERSYGVI